MEMNINMETYEEKKLERVVKSIEETIPEIRTPISYEKLEEKMSKWLLIKDKGLLRIVLACVVANKMEADPVWLFIVAAPGGTKTEIIRGLNKVDKIYPVSDLTPQTLLSGDKGKTSSLLLRLPYGTILTLKDFTTVLSMHRDKQQAIISQLREIFDGYYRKEFGTGETKTWEGKLGFIAGVTSIIDRHHEIYSVLGERFIQYRPTQSDPILLARKAMANSGGEKAMRDEIQNALADFIAGISIPKDKMLLDEILQDRIAHLATFCVKARSGIIRDGHTTREIDLIPETELPTRLAKQLTNMFIGLSLIRGHQSKEDYELIYKIGMDSLPQKRKRVLEILIEATDELETADVAMKIGYPTNTTRRILEDLHGLSLANRQHEGKGYADKWSISDYTKKLLEKARPVGLKVVKGSISEMSEVVEDPLEKLFEDNRSV